LNRSWNPTKRSGRSPRSRWIAATGTSAAHRRGVNPPSQGENLGSWATRRQGPRRIDPEKRTSLGGIERELESNETKRTQSASPFGSSDVDAVGKRRIVNHWEAVVDEHHPPERLPSPRIARA
jgi:hypothetical protein